MANKIILKKSSVAAKVPLVTDLVYGELALNYADGKLYYKTATNTIATLGYPGGSDTHVQFNDGGVLGGSSGFVFNKTTGNVGIGTASTGAKLELAETWNAGATVFTHIKSNVTDTASASGSSLLDLQVGSTSKFKIDKSGFVPVGGIGIGGTSVRLLAGNGNSIYINRTGTASYSELVTFYDASGTNAYVNLTSDAQYRIGGDTILARDAANVFAQRNGTTAQTSRIYNTYTDASNYERAKVGWATNVLEIGTEALGTGTLRNINLVGGNVGINTAAPGARLDVTSAVPFSARISGPANVYQDITDGTGTLRLQLLSNSPYITSIGSYPVSFGTNNTERMRLAAAGNLLVNLQNALANGQLQVAGSIGLSGNTQIRQATNADGNTLQVFATQFVAAPTNSNSYGYTGGGLIAAVSPTDSGVVLDAGRVVTTDGRFKVLNTTSGNITASLEKNSVYTLYGNTGTGNVGIGTGAPAARLHVAGNMDASTNRLLLDNDGGGSAIMHAGIMGVTNSGWTLSTGAAGGGTQVVRMVVGSTGNVGIGTTAPGYKLEVAGSFAATTKSFVIDHPTKPGMRLRYGSLEGPENGVYVRGRTKGNTIQLPDYWTGLVDDSSITVSLTPIGKHQKLYVKSIGNNQVKVGGGFFDRMEYFYTVFAERKDVEKLIPEI